MDSLNIFGYGGIAVLIILLVIFELKEGRLGKRRAQSGGYEYFTRLLVHFTRFMYMATALSKQKKIVSDASLQ